MPIIEFIVAHWRIFGCVFIFLGVGGYERYAGYQDAIEFHQDYVAKQTAEKLKMAQDNEDLKTKLEVSKNEAQTRIDTYIATHPTKRVLLPCTAPPVETHAASGVEATTTGREPLSTPATGYQAGIDRFMEQAEQLMLEADTTVNQCRVVIDWSNKQ